MIARFVLDHMVLDGVLCCSWRRAKQEGPASSKTTPRWRWAPFALYAATGEPEWYESGATDPRHAETVRGPEGGFFDTPIDGEPDQATQEPGGQPPSPERHGCAEALLVMSAYNGDADLNELCGSTCARGGMLSALPVDGGQPSGSSTGPRARTCATVGGGLHRPGTGLLVPVPTRRGPRLVLRRRRGDSSRGAVQARPDAGLCV